MPSIQRLPPHVVNKIAAGEVIERPASVVKELVENSLDAGATRIDVSVERGGLDLLRVVDNGCGIAADELALAVEPHATSKIRTADDLFRVATLGFRGEALASIASVSHFTLRSRQPGEPAGAELTLEGGVSAASGAGAVASEPSLAFGKAVALAAGGTSTTALASTTGGRAALYDDPVVALDAAVVPCGCPEGTAVEVRNLFFNTPVRRKFLKSTQTEIGHISEAVARLALAHPGVHFTLRHNGREVYDLPPTADWRQRIARFFGEELAAALIPIERAEPQREEGTPCRLFGYVAPPTHSRPNNRSQYFFLNGRCIRDRSLQHALSEAYRGLLLTGRYPIAFVCFELPADAVDVNVHPTKLEVRFQDGGRLYSLLLGTLRTRFLTTDLTAHWKPPGGSTVVDPTPSSAAHDPHAADEVRQELVAWAKGQLAGWEADDEKARPSAQAADPIEPLLPSDGLKVLDKTNAQVESSAARTSDSATFAEPSEASVPSPGFPLRLHKLDLSRFGNLKIDSGGAEAAERETASCGAKPPAPLLEGGSGPSASFRQALAATPAPAMQVHNRYLIAETAEGVLVIDQHALHERVLYEQLRAKVLAGAVECQNLLVPEPVDLSPAEAAAVLQERELLARLGVRVEPFGGDTVLVTSYPALLAGVNLLEMLRGVVERLLAGGKAPDRRDLIDELLHMMACKAAVKAGDRLTPEEIDALLQQRHLAQDTHHCPHGRPTALVLTREELDRQFLRT